MGTPDEVIAAQVAAETGPITGGLAELRAIRGHWRTLAPAAAALSELGFRDDARRVALVCNAIGAARFAIVLPCMLRCGRSEPVDVQIGDPRNSEPGAVPCGTCAGEIDEEVQLP